ncbi:hypothetical protein [Sphingomonas sp.]|uniref:hypothetical protein n=1 Tax=Sphingomonas sp. TaxID=28214 RepID=UPI001EB9AD58|nr:hypothetical protein [Sphingomonas sp.]MBX3593943.1 hypothetical protein [Sphingomonas sp.]
MTDGAVSEPGRPCPECGFAASHNYCADCGSPLIRGRAPMRAAKLMFAPLFDYFEQARAILFPRRLVDAIRAGRFGWGEALAFWLAATAIAALVNAVVDRPALTPVTLPIVDEVSEALIACVVLVLLYSPVHPLLNRGGRAVRYGAFVVTTLAIGALLYPWLVLVQGVMAALRVEDPVGITTPVTMFFFTASYAALYRRHWGKVLAWIVGYFLVLVIVVSAIGAAAGVNID